MRFLPASLLLLAASSLPIAAHAETVDVMTVTGNGHTWAFDFPLIQNFTYPTNLVLFIPGLTPLSATLDGASIAPTEIFFHAFQNMTGPFGQLMTPSGSVLDILSSSGPYTDPVTLQTYYAYTSTFFTDYSFFGTETIFNGNGYTNATFTIDVQQQDINPAPEPSSLFLLATGLAAALVPLRRFRSPEVAWGGPRRGTAMFPVEHFLVCR